MPVAGEIAVSETDWALPSQSSQQSAGVWGLGAGRENQTNMHISSNRTSAMTKETKDAKGTWRARDLDAGRKPAWCGTLTSGWDLDFRRMRVKSHFGDVGNGQC